MVTMQCHLWPQVMLHELLLEVNSNVVKIALAGVHMVSATCMFCLLQLCTNFSRYKSLKRKSLAIVSLLKSTTNHTYGNA